MQTPSAESTSKIGGSTLRIGRKRISAGRVGVEPPGGVLGKCVVLFCFENEEMIKIIKWAQFGRQSSE